MSYTTGAVGGLLGGGLSWGAAVTEGNKAWRRQKTAMQNQIRWRVADMRAAGINPILSVSPGAGASAPSVAMARTPDFAESMASGARAGTDAMRSRFQKKQSEAGVRQADSVVGANNAQAEATRVRANLDAEKILTEGFTRAMMENQADMYSANATKARAEAAMSTAMLPKVRAEGKNYSGDLERAMRAILFFDAKGPLQRGLAGAAGLAPQSGGPTSVGQDVGARLRKLFTTSNAEARERVRKNPKLRNPGRGKHR